MGCAISCIAGIMEAWAPRASAEPGDNCGLLCGSSGRSVDAVLISLDVSEAVINRAQSIGAGLVISHHPFIYKPLPAINDNTAAGRLAMKAIEASVALYAAHTNLDRAAGGVNDALACTVGLAGAEPVSPGAISRIAKLCSPVALDTFAARVRLALGAPSVRVTGRGESAIGKVLVISGAGRQFIAEALDAGADCMLTGEIGYHDAQDALNAGLAVIEAGHYHTERPVLEWIQKHLQKETQRLQYTVRAEVFGESTCPFHHVG